MAELFTLMYVCVHVHNSLSAWIEDPECKMIGILPRLFTANDGWYIALEG